MCSPRRITPTPPLHRLGAGKAAGHSKQYKFRDTTNETTGTQSISFRELKGVAAENYRYRLPLGPVDNPISNTHSSSGAEAGTYGQDGPPGGWRRQWEVGGLRVLGQGIIGGVCGEDSLGWMRWRTEPFYTFCASQGTVGYGIRSSDH